MKIKFLFISVLITLFVACKKEEYKPKIEPNLESEQPISSRQGMLIFKDEQTFNETVDKLTTFSREEADSWEAIYSFISQRNIFDQIVEAEDEYDNQFRKMKLSEAVNLPKHSNTYYEYLKKGLIVEQNKDTEDEIYNYSICNPSLAKVVNEQGLVAIEGRIYQLTAYEYKVLTDGDFSKISSLIKATSSDSANNILVRKVTKNSNSRVNGIYNWSGSSGWVSSGQKRILMNVYFDSDLGGGGFAIKSNHNVNVQCQEKNFWGNWKYQFTQISLNGKWNSRFRYITHTEEYTPTFFYSGSISNFYASINPADGSSAPYPSYFSYTTSTSGTPFWSELEMYNVNWTAVRDGGCCGLYAYVNH